MADIKLDPATGDLDLSSQGLELVDGVEAIAQHLRIRLRFFLGEWFLNEQIGIPYFEQILIKAPSTAVVRRILREAIIETPGIDTLTDLIVDYTPAARTLNVTFNATTVPDGTELVFDEELVIG